jgi:hypothetical protein
MTSVGRADALGVAGVATPVEGTAILFVTDVGILADWVPC